MIRREKIAILHAIQEQFVIRNDADAAIHRRIEAWIKEEEIENPAAHGDPCEHEDHGQSMNPNDKAREEWWAAILRRDGEHRDEVSSLLSCVFCNTRRAPEQMMLAWWSGRLDVTGRLYIQSAGLYCRGTCVVASAALSRCCVTGGGVLGVLLDMHADQARVLGARERLWTYPRWAGSAARRFSQIVDLLTSSAPQADTRR